MTQLILFTSIDEDWGGVWVEWVLWDGVWVVGADIGDRDNWVDSSFAGDRQSLMVAGDMTFSITKGPSHL